MQPYNPDHDHMTEHEDDTIRKPNLYISRAHKMPQVSRFSEEGKKPKCMPDDAFKAWVKRQQTLPNHKKRTDKKTPRDYWRSGHEHDVGDRGDGIDHFELW